MLPHGASCPNCATPLQIATSTCPSCGRFLPPGTFGDQEPTDYDRPEEIGLVLEGRYRIDGLISRGGMGAVFQGVDMALNRTIAVKFLADHLKRDPGIVDRFVREAQATANLQHNNIVPVYSVGQQDGRYYFVMAYIAGRTITQIVQSRGPFPLVRAIHAGSQVCDALAYVHAQGLVHRDIKSSNILIESSGRCVILDFGILRTADSHHTQAGMIAGTPEFMAPEQARDVRLADSRSDLYALGCVVFEMLTGRPPFTGNSSVELLLKHQNELPPKPSELVSELHEGVDAFVARALEKDPQDRYQTAEQMKIALEKLRHPRQRAGVGGPVPAVERIELDLEKTRRSGSSSSSAQLSVEPLVVEPRVRHPLSPAKRSRRSSKAVGITIAIVLTLGFGAAVGWYILRKKEPAPPPAPIATKAPEQDGVVTTKKVAAGNTGIRVLSEPKGAMVRLGSLSLGKTPMKRTRLSPGVYQLNVEKRGYRPWTKMVKLAEGDEKEVKAKLELEPVSLTVVTLYKRKPVWANLHLNGRSVGSSPLVGHRVMPGRYTVVATRAGFFPVSRTVRLRVGKSKKLNLRLTKKPEK